MHTSLTEGKVSTLLIKFSLPFLLSSIIMQAYSSVDIIILGRYAETASIAGAGNGASLVMTVTSFFMGLATGGMILLGQFVGAKQDDKAAKTIGNIVILQIAIVAVSMAIVYTLGPWFIKLVRVPDDAVGEAWNYMRVCAAGLIFQAGYGMISSILRALGNSRTPLYFVAAACAMNIVLDLLFVASFHWGAFGAALATIISQAFSLALALTYVMIKKLRFKFSLRDARPDVPLLGSMMRLGIPICLQTVLNLISFIWIGAIINEMGLNASAANGIVNNVVNIYMIIPMAIGSALSAIAAQNLGAGKTDRALQSAKLGVMFSLIIAIPVTLFASFFPTTIVQNFAVDPDVIKASAAFLVPFSWDCLFVSFVFCINGFFNGCGITTFVAVHETVAAFAVRIPVSIAMSYVPAAALLALEGIGITLTEAQHLFYVGIGTPAATLASLIMCLVYYKVKLSDGKIAHLKLAG